MYSKNYNAKFTFVSNLHNINAKICKFKIHHSKNYADRATYSTQRDLQFSLDTFSDMFKEIRIKVRNLGRVNKFEAVYVCKSYTGCPMRNMPDFGRVFLMLKYTDIT